MKIVSLHRYPVKSMMGEELNASYITSKGLYGDRAFGIFDSDTGMLANAKNPKKWPTMFRHHSTYSQPVIFPEQLPPVQITLPTGEVVSSNDETIDERLSTSFGRTVTLRSYSANAVGFDDSGITHSHGSSTDTFFDSATVHIITTNTIDALRKLVPESRIEARRFRANLIIDVPDVNGFIEESWIGKTVHIGDNVRLKITQPTKRCVMTTLAQGDLPNDMNVLKTLVQKNSGNFGVYAEVIQTGPVRVADKISII